MKEHMNQDTLPGLDREGRRGRRARPKWTKLDEEGRLEAGRSRGSHVNPTQTKTACGLSREQNWAIQMEIFRPSPLGLKPYRES
jgi:hypothetical protein